MGAYLSPTYFYPMDVAHFNIIGGKWTRKIGPLALSAIYLALRLLVHYFPVFTAKTQNDKMSNQQVLYQIYSVNSSLLTELEKVWTFGNSAYNLYQTVDQQNDTFQYPIIWLK